MVCFLNHIVSILYERGLRCGAVYYTLMWYCKVISDFGLGIHKMWLFGKSTLIKNTCNIFFGHKIIHFLAKLLIIWFRCIQNHHICVLYLCIWWTIPDVFVFIFTKIYLFRKKKTLQVKIDSTKCRLYKHKIFVMWKILASELIYYWYY